MTAIDGTGLHALEALTEKLRASGREVILCGMRAQPRQMMLRAEFHVHIEPENMCHNVRDALRRARALLSNANARSVSAPA